MYKEKDRKVTVETLIDKRKKLKDGTYPIKVRVTYKAKQKYYPVGKNISETEWSKACKANKGNVRLRVKAYFDHVLSNVVSLLDQNAFSLNELDDSLKTHTEKTLNSIIAAKIEKFKSNNQFSSIDSYKCTLSCIERFKHKSVALTDVTPKWLKELENFMSKDKSVNTIAIYMRNIKACMNVAKRAKYITEDGFPFGAGKYQIKKGTGVKKAVGLEQLKSIASCDDLSNVGQRYRDYWLFLYLANGMNVADFIELKYKNISDGEISYVRKKTAGTNSTIEEIRITLTEEIKDIIDKYGIKETSPDSYIFGHLDGTESAEEIYKKKKNLTKRINNHTKKLGKILGITNLTTYVGRHSFATRLKEKGVNIAKIKEALGHSSMATTDSYLKSFEKEHRAEIAKLTSLK